MAAFFQSMPRAFLYPRDLIHRRAVVLMALICAILFTILDTLPTWAGVYNANDDVTYKEYWLPHSEFTGGIDDTLPGCVDTVPNGGAFYLEPVNSCSKTVHFTINDNFADALKIEIYLDLWRNHVPPSASFQINNGPIHQPPVGYNWSRTPYIAAIDKSELVRGANVIKFMDTNGAYHIHDAAFRIYFDDAHPLRDANGATITAPQGRLLTIWADNGLFNATDGGTLQVDDDQLVLTAQVDTPAQFVEFHGYYDGYDEDNDGQFVDWHNATRNNFYPGGTTPSPLGGTIDHIGTVAVGAPGQYMTHWLLPYIVNQSGVKFKIRLVDRNYVVREAAGGVSAPFTLSRSKNVQSYYDAGFVDAGIYQGGNKPLTITRSIQLPNTLNVADFQEGYFLGAYWQNPNIAINSGTKFKAFSGGEDSWALSVRKISPTLLHSGKNNLVYTYSSGFGQFVEKPGGMIVLKQTTRATDNAAPVITSRSPAANASDVAPEANISVVIKDNPGRGVDLATLRLKVNGSVVTPQVSGTPDEYTLTYDPPTMFPLNTNVTVAVDGCDYAGKCMATNTYTFAIRRSQHTLAIRQNGQGTAVATPAKPLYTYGDVVQLSATPANGWTFVSWLIDQGNVSGWWNSDWHYRVGLTVAADGVARVERPVESAINFTELLHNLGETGAFDPNALRVVEVDATGALLDAAVPFQFDPDVAYDATTNASGTLIFLMEGNTPADGSRHYHIYFDLAARQLPPATVSDQVIITDGIADEGQESFQIETANATYTFHKEGCGFASMIDVNGNDWIDYHAEPDNSAGAFRGIPNMVPPPDGLFHPGHLIGNATQFSYGPLKESIRCATYDNKWEVQWDFFPKFARMTLLRKNPSQNYWFLYEGTPGGLLENSDKIVRSDGSVTDLSGSWAGDLAAPEWVYFYDNDVDNAATAARSIFLVHHEDDNVVDSYRPNGSGNGKMTIFGFGRDGSGNNTFMTQAPQHFTIGFMDETDFTAAATVINSSYRDLLVTQNAPQMRGAISGEVVTTPAFALTIQRNTIVTATFTTELYQLTTPVIGDGVLTRNPDKTLYDLNESVELAAQAQVGWYFVGWSGDASGSDNPLTVQLNTSKTITGTFAPIDYTVAINTDGQGAVTWTPQQASYHYSDTLIITATAALGWHFAGWSDGVAAAVNPRILTVDGNKTLQATFVQDEYTIDPQIMGDGAVTLTPLQASYHYGDQVTVTATAQPGWRFSGWSGALANVTNPSQLLIDSNKAITATFVPIEYSLTIGQEGEGLVTQSPISPTYHYNANVSLTATPADGWQFQGWQGDLSGMTNPIDITIDSDKVVTATFVPRQYSLTLRTAGSGSGHIVAEPAGPYTNGQTVTLHAIADAGSRFARWQGGVTANPQVVTIMGDRTETAVFAQESYRITTKAVDEQGQSLGNGLIVLSPPKDGNSYRFGEQVTVTAQPQAGWRFLSWTDGVSGASITTVLTVEGDLLIVGRFTPLVYHTLTVTQNAEGGTVAITPAGPYLAGQVITLTVTLTPGWEFTGWSGDLSGNANPLTLVLDHDKALVANFAQVAYQLTLALDDSQGHSRGGHIIADPVGPYLYGQEITLTAIADEGYTFVAWHLPPTLAAATEGDGSTATIHVKVVGNYTYTAQFQAVTERRIFIPVVIR